MLPPVMRLFIYLIAAAIMFMGLMLKIELTNRFRHYQS